MIFFTWCFIENFISELYLKAILSNSVWVLMSLGILLPYAGDTTTINYTEKEACFFSYQKTN